MDCFWDTLRKNCSSTLVWAVQPTEFSNASEGEARKDRTAILTSLGEEKLYAGKVWVYICGEAGSNRSAVQICHVKRLIPTLGILSTLQAIRHFGLLARQKCLQHHLHHRSLPFYDGRNSHRLTHKLVRSTLHMVETYIEAIGVSSAPFPSDDATLMLRSPR